MPHEINQDYYDHWATLTQGERVKPILEMTLDFGISSYRFNTTRSFSPMSATFLNDGTLMDISFPRENILREIQSWSVTVATINANLKASILTAKHHTLLGDTTKDVPLGELAMWFVDDTDAEDDQSNLVIATGVLDTCEIIEGGDQMIANLTFWNGPEQMWDEIPHLRMTPDFQKRIPLVSGIPADPSNDKGFDYVPLLQNWTLFWGKGKGSGGSGGHKHKGKHKHRKG